MSLEVNELDDDMEYNPLYGGGVLSPQQVKSATNTMPVEAVHIFEDMEANAVYRDPDGVFSHLEVVNRTLQEDSSDSHVVSSSASDAMEDNPLYGGPDRRFTCHKIADVGEERRTSRQSDVSFVSKDDVVLYANPNRVLYHHRNITSQQENFNNRCNKIVLIAAIVAIAVYTLLSTVAFAVAFVNIAELKSRKPTVQQIHTVDTRIEALLNTIQQIGPQIERNMNETRELGIMLDTFYMQFSENLSKLENETLSVIDDINLRTIGTPFNPAPSCAALPPSSPSGYYWVRASNGSAVHVYCDMTRSCGGVTGGWMRVAELDMTNSSQQCPGDLQMYTDDVIRVCVRNTNMTGCSSLTILTANIQYSQVCGRITAYQFATPDAFKATTAASLSIDATYVDGVSLTHGRSPREHIWTFAAALDESGSANPLSICPCSNSSASTSVVPPDFVGDDYFCDSGSRVHDSEFIFFSDDPLWDGAGCGPVSTCCSFNTPPWFYKQLPQPTTDDIEMRVCRDEAGNNEDIAIEVIEILVQ